MFLAVLGDFRGFYCFRVVGLDALGGVQMFFLWLN